MTRFSWNLILVSFWVCWLRIWTDNLEIQNGGFNTATENFLSDSISMKFRSRRFLRMLITNLDWKSRNSKWRFQYGHRKWLDFGDTWYSGVFEVADYESQFRIFKYKIPDSIWQPKIFQVIRFWWNLIHRGFWGCWLRIWT